MKRTLILGLAVCVAALTGLLPAGATGSGAPTLAQWKAAARDGHITLDLGGSPTRVTLTPNEILAPSARASLAHHGVDVSDIATFEGAVDGGGSLRLTLSDEAAIGYVSTPSGTLDIAATPDVAALRAPALTGLMIDDGAPSELHFDCSSFIPGHVANPAGIRDGWGPRIEFDLAVVVDQTYATNWSRGDGSWANDAIATVNAADAIYDQLNIDVNLVDLHTDTFAAATSSTLLSEIVFHYRAYHAEMDRDAVALLVYKEIGPLGQASCISGAGMYERGNLVMTTNAAPFTLLGVEFYSNIYGKTLAHEMGHLLSAHHHYSNCVQATRQPLTDACTLMTPFVDELDEVIGSVEALVMRGWAEGHL